MVEKGLLQMTTDSVDLDLNLEAEDLIDSAAKG